MDGEVEDSNLFQTKFKNPFRKLKFDVPKKKAQVTPNSPTSTSSNINSPKPNLAETKNRPNLVQQILGFKNPFQKKVPTEIPKEIKIDQTEVNKVKKIDVIDKKIDGQNKRKQSKVYNSSIFQNEDEDPDKYYSKDDVDRYRARNLMVTIKTKYGDSGRNTSLQNMLVIMSTLPYFFGLILVSYISVYVSYRQNYDITQMIGNSERETSFRSAKKITSQLSSILQSKLSAYIDSAY